MRCAAAASPIGPPPITATGSFARSRPCPSARAENSICFALIFITPSVIPERSNNKPNKLRHGTRSAALRSGVRAAFRRQKAEKLIHGGIVRPADQHRRAPLLRDEPGQYQPMQMMREGRGGDAELFLQTADGEPRVAGTDEDSIDLQARRVAERFKLRGCVFELHVILRSPKYGRGQP